MANVRLVICFVKVPRYGMVDLRKYILRGITLFMERPGKGEIIALVSTSILVVGTLAYTNNDDVRHKVDDVYEHVFNKETAPKSTSVNMAAGAAGMPCTAGEVIYGVQTSVPEIAITIDDGPSPQTTRANLEVAKKHGAKITFFAIADRLATPEGAAIANEIIAQGHEIAVHSNRHVLGQPDVNAAEHATANQIFTDTVGFVPYANRAPGLAYSAAYSSAVTSAGQCFIDISEGADTKDWQCDFAPPQQASAGIENRAQNVVLQAGGIVLMHDQTTDAIENGSRERARPNSPHELDMLLTRTENLGLQAVTVSELLQDGTHINTSVADNGQSEC